MTTSSGRARRAALTALSRGFRERFLRYDELTAQVHAWAEAFPDLVRVRSIGETPEGRSLWLLEIGPEPDRIRPAAWVDGNMHASELAGSSVALAIAEDAIARHLAGDEPDEPDEPSEPSDESDEARKLALSRAVRDRLRDVLFYVLPRMSPDGAEVVLASGRYVRSIPRDDRPGQSHPRWRAADLDGDGSIGLMRVRDPAGELVESGVVPGLMMPRTIDDEGPFYKLYPEGEIENFDGHHVPTPHFLSDNRTDLNRNFPWSWAPAHEQMGAGAFPTSEPESRAVVEFTAARPHIFSWLNLHTFGGVLIRPFGHLPDNKMPLDDLGMWRQIGAWSEQLTGYPAVSGFEEFLYEPDKPLHGDLTDYAYNQLGAVAFVVELWDLFAQLGMKRGKRFVDYYSAFRREDLEAFGRWDREHNAGRVVGTWRPFEHPQLGAVELGGFDPRVGVWNPPYELLPAICARQSALHARVASLAPAVEVEVEVEVGRVGPAGDGDGLTRLVVKVENRGYLPTHVLASARSLENAEPVYATVTTEGCALLDPSLAHREVGHLDGWGRGLFGSHGALHAPITRGTTGARTLVYAVRGRGTVKLRVGACRIGWVEREIEI